MNKKIISFCCLSLFFLFVSIPVVNATTIKVGTIKDGISAATVYDELSDSKQALSTLTEKETFIINDTETSGYGCSDSWYFIEYYESKVGYICSTNVNVSDVSVTDTFDNFPITYRSYLIKLRAMHPNWVFTPFNSGISWSQIISGENYLGKNLLQDCYGTLNGWKNLASYDFVTNTFFNGYSGGGACWYAPSDEVLGYYIDPRNFINTRRVFMFEKLSYDDETQTVEQKAQTLQGMTNMLSSTFMSGSPTTTIEDITNGKTYAQIFMDAAGIYNVSPYYLASLVIQEVGRNRSTIVSGTYSGYEGYYNFYNIGATGAESQLMINGLSRAKAEGWNSEYDAIIGGARFVATGYIDKGQDTTYYQKWDIFAPNMFGHQYQQNIQAPYTQSGMVYSSYRGIGAVNNAFEFSVPVYTSMPTSTSLPGQASSVNYLRNIKLNDINLIGFNSDIIEYTINVSKDTTSIVIAAVLEDATSTVEGIGTIQLPDDANLQEITVTAANGIPRTYKLNIIKVDGTVSYVMDKTGMKYDASFIKGIVPGTNSNTMINNIRVQNINTSVIIKDSTQVVKDNANLSTGDTVNVTIGDENVIYSVVVYGDTNGSGDITIMDMLRVQKVLLGMSDISGAYLEAADVNRDGSTTIIDLLRVQKHVLGESLLY